VGYDPTGLTYSGGTIKVSRCPLRWPRFPTYPTFAGRCFGLEGASPDPVPGSALLDMAGEPLLDMAGEYLLEGG
jgi:hypothetical protein